MTLSPNEQCLRIEASDPDGRPAIILVPPLFDEGNRMRRTLVLTMRALAMHGHASALPDLPGQNDSLLPTEAATLTLWRSALAEFASHEGAPVILASWRGGALIDDAVPGALGWWRMAPLAGASIVRAMMRTRIASEKEAGRIITAEDLRTQLAAGPVELAGNRLNAVMVTEVEAASPARVSPCREVSLGSADASVPGSALWLRAEPGEDATMAQAMAADISAWAMQCAAG